MRMRVRLSVIGFLGLLVAAVVIAGCGTSRAPSKPAVSLSILAPTSGATIGVRDIVVAGTVAPATATVRIGGQPVKVVHGTYNLPLHMSSPSETITVSGQASGYKAGSATTTVQYSAAIASAIAAADSTAGSSSSATSTDPSSTGSSGAKATKAATPAAHAAAAAVTSAKQTSASAKPAASHSTTTKHKAGTHKTSSHAGHKSRSHASHKSSSHNNGHRSRSHDSHKSSSHNGHKSSSHNGHKSSSHGGYKPHSKSSHKSSSSKSSRSSKHHSSTHKSSSHSSKPQRSKLTVKKIKQLWIKGCVKPGTGESYKPYCRCTYAHLAKAGALSSRKRLRELMRKLKPYERTHNVASLPAVLRGAIYACVSKLPPPDPTVGKPVVNDLPNTTHPATPHSTPAATGITPSSGTPASTPAPTGAIPTGIAAPAGTTPTPTTPPTGTTNSAPTRSNSGTPPPWASLVRELNRVITAIAGHHPTSSAPTDHRSVRKSHRRAAKWWGSPEGSQKWSF